jgi:hypothetical protein
MRLLLAAGVLATASAAMPQEAEPSADPLARAQKMLETADEVMAEVEAIRGWKFKRPVAKDVRTEAQLREFLEAKIGNEREIAEDQAWLRLLGLVPPDLDVRQTLLDVLINQIGGFYDPETRAFYMMAESARFDDVTNRMLIAHELCHALDDQYIDLQALIEPEGRELTEDESFAVGAMVEGSATALMFAWMARAMAEITDAKDMLAMQEAELERAKPLIEAPRYFSLLVANYMVGQFFIAKGQNQVTAMRSGKSDSGAAILEAAVDPPRSSEQVLHPEKYWDPEQRDEPVRVADDGEVAALVEQLTGLHRVTTDTLGELVCSLLGQSQDRKVNLALTANPGYWTNRYAEGWGGDRLYLLARRAPGVEADLTEPRAVWVTAWDTAKDREEFVGVMRRYRGETPGFSVAEDGRAAVFALPRREGDETLLQQVLAVVRFEQAGEEWRHRP